MAKLCVSCGGLCAYFLIFLGITAVSSVDDYLFRGVGIGDKANEYHVVTDLESQVRHLHKRDVENNQSNSPSRPSGTTVAPIQNNTVATQNQTRSGDGVVPVVDKTPTDNKISSSKAKLEKTAKIAPPLTTTGGALDGSQKLLGVNGTGQRINVTAVKPMEYNDTTPVAPLNVTTKNDIDENVTISSFPIDDEGDEFNNTLAENNITSYKTDAHLYYNSTLITDLEVGNYFWVNISNLPDTKVNELLSRSHRRAATVKLSFDFPFYGHLIKNVTIATGGFLYTGDYVHSWLAATQYIAPLMANFDTSISDDSVIRYNDNGTAFTVEWEKVVLQDKPNVGEFTFQTTLHKNGDIVFVYRNIPLFVKNIEDDHHPVKVGLSDAYVIDRTIFLVRRKTIYEYHRINFFKEDIKNGTVIYLTALPTCLQNDNCTTCLTNELPLFHCHWCPTVSRCSNGVDRHRQDWLTKGCEKKQIDNETMCYSHISGADIFEATNMTYSHDANKFQQQMQGYSDTSARMSNNASPLGSNHPVKMGVSSIMAILFLIAMTAGLAVWVLYAYRNPHTASGQILIKYRPSQWRWRRGEARYTAATIHM